MSEHPTHETLLDLALDLGLDPTAETPARAHVAACEPCAAALRALETEQALLRDHLAGAAAPEAAGLAERIAAAVRAEGSSLRREPVHPGATPALRISGTQRVAVPRRRLHFAVASAVAAAIVAAVGTTLLEDPAARERRQFRERLKKSESLALNLGGVR